MSEDEHGNAGEHGRDRGRDREQGALRAVVAGPDPDDLGGELEARGVTVTYAEGTANRPALEEAGIVGADLLVVTDAGLATSIPVALDLEEGLRVVVYTRDSLPEFVAGQAGHVVDPELIGPEVVAEELVGNGA